VSAFGYGSSYSFKDGNLNPGMTDGMGMDPRSIVPRSQVKGGLSSGSAPLAPGAFDTTANGGIGNPYGLNMNREVTQDPGGLTGGGQMTADNPYGISGKDFWSLAYAPNNFGIGVGQTGVSTGQYAAGDMGNMYQGAFDQLNYDQTQAPGNSFFASQKNDLQKRYEDWIKQMMSGGGYGMGGTTSYGGGF